MLMKQIGWCLIPSLEVFQLCCGMNKFYKLILMKQKWLLWGKTPNCHLIYIYILYKALVRKDTQLSFDIYILYRVSSKHWKWHNFNIQSLSRLNSYPYIFILWTIAIISGYRFTVCTCNTFLNDHHLGLEYP